MEKQSVATTIGGILGSAILAAIGYTGSTITELSTRIGALEQQTTMLETVDKLVIIEWKILINVWIPFTVYLGHQWLILNKNIE